MSTYKVAVGHVAAGSVVLVNPQPTGEAAAPVERDYALSGKVHDQGLFVVWRWEMVESEAEYIALIAQFGLNNGDSWPVTIYTPNKRYAYGYFHGTAQLPEPGSDIKRNNYFLNDITIYLTHLQVVP